MHLPRGSRVARIESGAQDLAECGRTDLGPGLGSRLIGLSEIRMIEDVEKLCSELQLERFPETGCLEDREIEIVETWSYQRVASDVSEHRRP